MTTELETVVIPKQELDKLEESRVMLWDFADREKLNPRQLFELEKITSVMWRLANRKWPTSV